MDNLAILIPTYKRSSRFEKLIQNIDLHTTCTHTVYLILEKEDKKSIEEAERLNIRYFINQSPYTYVSAINTGYKETTEPFVLCAADDVVFTKDWDVPISKAFEDPKIGIVGSTDSWPINQTGCHSSHFTVRREYIQKYGGVYDEVNTIYSSKYSHYHCDVETLHTAMHRGAFKQCPDSVIDHNHFVNSKAEIDETYERGKITGDADNKLFEERRYSFEYWHYFWLWKGKKYRVNDYKLSIIIPSFNALEYLKRTLLSLAEHTYHNFELIIIDDASDAETVEFIEKLNCVKVFNKKQKFTNANWNTGIKLATGDYIAILNNDIELSHHWDVPLLNALNDDVWLSSGYQTDSECRKPYGKSARTGNLNLHGICFMVRKDLFKKIGYFPEQMRLWCGDSWMSWIIPTVYRKAMVFVEDTVVFHWGSKSTASFRSKSDEYQQMIANDNAEFTKIVQAYENSKR